MLKNYFEPEVTKETAQKYLEERGINVEAVRRKLLRMLREIKEQKSEIRKQ